MTLALRTALIWHDEVMSDVVVDKPTVITLGNSGTSTFVVPDLGLPQNFAVVRPGNRGYLLTLGERMRGTICLDGEEKDIEEFVRRGGEGAPSPGESFRATSISGKDWGVIDLDESGDYKLFFQFVPLDEAPVFFTKPVLYAGVGGYLLASLALTVLWALRGYELSEAGFRGAGLATLTMITASLGWWLIRQDGESQASFAFSVLLHVALLFLTYQLYEGNDPFVWPGPRSLAGNYLVTRLDPEVPDPPKATVGKVNNEAAAAANPEKKNVKTATKGATGEAGGKGAKERASDPNNHDKVGAPEVALMTRSNKKVLDDMIQAPVDLGNFANLGYQRTGTVGSGEGTGTGFGPGIGTGTTRGGKGKGPGGGGNVEGDFQTKAGPIDTGKNRPGGTCVGPNCTGAAPKAVAIKLEEATGDFNGLSKDEIDRVVKARAGVFKACYQKELNRSPGIGGKLVIHFVIASDGSVKNAATQGGSLRNEGVESCVKGNIMRLKFPAKGGAIVNYPFLFTQGG